MNQPNLNTVSRDEEPDANARVAKLLSSPWKSDSKEFLRVETIQGRKVKLETIDYAHAPFQTHTFWVTVDAMGGVAARRDMFRGFLSFPLPPTREIRCRDDTL